jgi:type II secretory pathway pseudopilin PulG
MRKIKRSFTLVELVISLTLFSLLLSSLFFWYRHINVRTFELRKEAAKLTERRYIQQQLAHFFSHAQTPLFTYEKGLLFFFDRGLYEEAELSGKVAAYLYHDAKSGSLLVRVWPDPDPMRKFSREMTQAVVICDQVEELSFEFYHPPPPDPKSVSPVPVGKEVPSIGWQKKWLQEFGPSPALIKVCLKRNQEEEKYLFLLPETKIPYA